MQPRAATPPPEGRTLESPLYNIYGADLVSKRVGNYRYNPVRGALLSQLWVR